MRRLLIVVIALSAALQTSAQTATSTASWQMPGNILADANTFNYSLKDGTAAAVPMTATSCVGLGTPVVVTCSGTVATPAPGSHSWTVIAASPDGTLQAASVPKVGIMPAAPTGVKISITLTFP